jgi:hypothetical protein
MGLRLLLLLTVVFVSSLLGCGDDDATDASCSPWCTVVDECTETSFSDCMEACAKELSDAQAVSSECANAVRSQNTCVGELNCAEFESWRTETPPDAYPCKSADDAVVSACSA